MTADTAPGQGHGKNPRGEREGKGGQALKAPEKGDVRRTQGGKARRG